MRAIVLLSDRYRGQLRFASDDPFFFTNSGVQSDLMEDGTLINQDMVASVCSKVAERYELSVADDAVPRVKELMDCSDVSTPSFTPPDGFALKGYQKRAVHALRNERNCMVQTSPGTGKTVMSIFMACQRLDAGECDRVIVFCPSSLVKDWCDAITMFTSLRVGTVNKSLGSGKRAEWFANDGSTVWVLNYERLRTADSDAIKAACKHERVLFIMDEVQKVKNRTSALHKEMLKLTKAVGGCAGKIALTATPIVRGPEDFYNEFRIIDPSVFGTVRDFERLFCYNGGERDFFGNYIGYTNLAMMHAMAGAQIFSATKTRPEIACEFPEKQEIMVGYDLTPKMRQLYQEIYAYGASLQDREGSLFMLTFMRICNMPQALYGEHCYYDTPYGQQLRAIDAICERYRDSAFDWSENAKLQLLEAKVDEIVQAGEKVIVFAQHTNNCLFWIARYLERYNPLLYTGDMSDSEKETAKTTFKTDSTRNVMLMSDAGQTGLNFQECRYLIHYQTPTSHAAYEQRSDRVHRVDSKHDSVEIIRFCGDSTIEERVEETMTGRREMSVTMGFGSEYEEAGTISQEDADYFCGF